MESLKRNKSSILDIRRSLSSFGKGIVSATSISNSINSNLVSGNRDKRNAIIAKSKLYNVRRQAVLRREKEDVIEASQISTLSKISPNKKISSSTKGFLGRIMDVLGATLVGWAIFNLPSIIEGVTDLVKRIRKTIQIFQTWYDNTTKWFTSLTSDLDDKLNQLRNISIDFEISEIERSDSENKNIFQKIYDSIIDNVNLLRSPTGKKPGQEPPTVNPSSFSGKVGGNPKGLLKFISSAEGGYGSTYSGHLSDFSRAGEDITQMTISQLVQYQNDYLAHQRAKGVPKNSRSAAVGAYQMLYPDKFVKAAGLTMSDKFTPGNQDKLIIAYMASRGLTAERAKKDPSGFAKGLSQAFAGVPVLEAMQGDVQPVERGQSYYRGRGSNAATTSPEKVEEAIKLFGESYKPSTNQSNNNVNPNLNANVSVDKTTNLALDNESKTIEVPVPVQIASSPAPQQSQSSGEGDVKIAPVGGTSLNSFIFTELQYT